MNFNLVSRKKALDILLSRKLHKVSHPKLVFLQMDVSQTNSQKYLRVIFKLIFHNHLDIVFTKVRKTIGLLHKLNNILPRATLLTTFKVFIRPQLDYGDVLYDLSFNSAFHDKLESIQYNACFTITGAIRCTSRGKLHQELG